MSGQKIIDGLEEALAYVSGIPDAVTPADVKRTAAEADRLVFRGELGVAEAVAVAILAERERCALIAEEHRQDWHRMTGNPCERIAAAIREDAEELLTS